MRIDHSLIGHVSSRAATESQWAEQIGFDGVWATESVTDAFLQSMAVSLSTSAIEIGTAIAVAFARNPMSTAYAAWDLAAASNGRFTLGLGTQVEAHIVRRYSMPWSAPVERMTEYLRALDAIFHVWRTGERLRFEGASYQHTLMSPVFTPPLHDHRIPTAIAAVGPRMMELAGEMCNAVILHGMVHPAYLDEVALPALDRGLGRSGRDRSAISLSCPLFMVMGDTDEELASAAASAREQIAFYASTPAYRRVLEPIGYDGLQPELQQLSRAGRWRDMGTLIDDTLLHHLALVGTPEEMPRLVHGRFGDRLDRVSSYYGWSIEDPERLAAIIAAFRDRPASKGTT